MTLARAPRRDGASTAAARSRLRRPSVTPAGDCGRLRLATGQARVPCSSPFAASTPTAASFARAGDRTRARSRSSPKRAAPADVAVPVAAGRRRAAGARGARGGVLRHPSDELTLVGITGTNGKTTTSYLLTSIFEAAGSRAGASARSAIASASARSTRRGRRRRRRISSACCARWSPKAAAPCVMEVSSHALALRRADELRFAAGIFTNLTRDHLDFHGDMEAYFRAKRRLFELLPDGGVGVDQPRRSARRGVRRGRDGGPSPTRSTRRPTFGPAR